MRIDLADAVKTVLPEISRAARYHIDNYSGPWTPEIERAMDQKIVVAVVEPLPHPDMFPPKNTRAKSKDDRERITRQARPLLAAGATLREVATSLGVGAGTLCRWLRR